jgi:hypothetical protein
MATAYPFKSAEFKRMNNNLGALYLYFLSL